MTPTDPKSAARKEASWLVSRLTTTDLVLDSRQYSLLRESITDALHAKNERIRKLEETIERLERKAAMAPGHHLERSGFCNVCGQPNEHVPCACVPVQEVGAGKDKCEQPCSHDFYPQNGLCAYCGLSKTDARICDLQRENEELRKSLRRTKKHLADANRGAERQQKVNMIHCDTINTLRARLDKAVKALEPFAAMKDNADAYIMGLRDSGEKTADFHLDAEVGKVTYAQAAIAQQTLADIRKGRDEHE